MNFLICEIQKFENFSHLLRHSDIFCIHRQIHLTQKVGNHFKLPSNTEHTICHFKITTDFAPFKKKTKPETLLFFGILQAVEFVHLYIFAMTDLLEFD